MGSISLSHQLADAVDPVLRLEAVPLRVMIDVGNLFPVLDDGRRDLADEVGEVRHVERDERELEAFGVMLATRRQVGKNHRAGVHLIDVALVIDVHGLYGALDDGA